MDFTSHQSKLILHMTRFQGIGCSLACYASLGFQVRKQMSGWMLLEEERWLEKPCPLSQMWNQGQLMWYNGVFMHKISAPKRETSGKKARACVYWGLLCYSEKGGKWSASPGTREPTDSRSTMPAGRNAPLFLGKSLQQVPLTPMCHVLHIK